MDILYNWKLQGGKGTYVYDDHDDLFNVINYLVTSISKMDKRIRIVCPTNKLEYYKKKIDTKEIIGYTNAMFGFDSVYLLILMDIERIDFNLLKTTLAINGCKYLFCTSTSVDLPGNVDSKIAPIIKKDKVYTKKRKITPTSIKVINVSIDLDEENKRIYDGYTERMTEIFSYFDGDFNEINNCYKGDRSSGITADRYRRQFAHRNGWEDTLDTSIEYFDKVDKAYNPNAVYEQAKLYHELMNKRNHFVEEHNGKCYFVHKLLSYYSNRRYVILCRNNFMADKVHEFLDKHNTQVKSKAIHKDLKSVHLRDSSGNIITYGKKSAKAGQPKEFGHVVQSRSYIDWFNKGYINVLVITNAINKGVLLKDVDIIIRLSSKAFDHSELSKRVNLRVSDNYVTVNACLTGTREEAIATEKYKNTKYDIKHYNSAVIQDIIL